MNHIKTAAVSAKRLSLLIAGIFLCCHTLSLSAVNFSSGTIDSANAGYFTQIVVDSNGGKHAVYATSIDSLRYSSAPANGSWGPFTTIFNGSCTSWISVAIDTTTVPNKLHLSAYNSTLGDLVYAAATIGASSIIWSSSTVNGTGDVGKYTSIAIDSLGNPHISYRDNSNGILKYSSYTAASGWQSYTVDDSPGTDSGLFTSIKIGSNGLRHIVYGSWPGADYDLKIATKTAVGWSTSTIVSAGAAGIYCNLAIEPNGDLHVSYWDEISYSLKYIKRLSGAWQPATAVDSNIGTGAMWNSIGLDYNNKPHIAYYEGNLLDLKYANFTTVWNTQTVHADGNVGEYASLCLQNFPSSSTVHIACYNSTLGDAVYSFGWYGTGAAPVEISNLMASIGSYAGAVKLNWTYPQTLSPGSSYYIEYSTAQNNSWSYNNAQIIQSTSVNSGWTATVNAGGLDVGRDGSGTMVSPDYYFRVWITTSPGAFSALSNSASNYANTPAAGTDNLTNYPDGWCATFNGANNEADDGNSMKRDSSNNFYVIGKSSNSSDDIIVRKYGPTGLPLWTKYYNSPANNSDNGDDIAVDSIGNVYISGVENRSDLGQNSNILVRKYNANGLLLWTTTYNSPANAYDEGTGIAVDTGGNVYVTGIANNDVWVRKYDTNGLILWTTTYNSPANDYDTGKSVALDNSNNNVYVIGHETRSDLVQSRNILLTKYDKDGQLIQWTTTYTSPGNNADWGDDVEVDSNDNVYVSGYETITGQNYNIWLRKYNSSGGVQWTATYNNPSNDADWGQKIAVDNYNNVYIAGIINRADLSQGTNIWFSKYDMNGLIQWTTTYTSPGNNHDGGYGTAVDNSGNVYVFGTETIAGQKSNLWMRKYDQTYLTEPKIASVIGTTNTVTFNWADSNYESSYTVKTADGFVKSVFNPNVSSYTLTGLTPNVSTSVYITAYNSWSSSSSVTVSTYTLAVPPSGSYVLSRTSYSIEIDWSSNSNPSYTRWGIFRSTDGFTTNATTLKSFSDNYTSVVSYNDSGLSDDATYWYRICAYNENAIASDFDVAFSTKTLPEQTPPVVIDNQSGDVIIRSTGTIYNVDFFDAGGLDTVQYKVTSQLAQAGVTIKDWTNIAVLGGTTYYQTDWSVDFNSLLSFPTTNYVSVRAWDVAGNTATLNDVFYVMKDTAPPSSSIISPSDATNVQALTYISGVVSDNFGINKVELQIKRLSDNYYWTGGSWGAASTWLQASNNIWQYYGLTDTALTPGNSYWIVSRASDTAGNVETPGAGNTFTYKLKKTIASGNSNNAGTWFGGQMPLDGDVVIISPNHTVTLTADTSALYSLTIESGGKLDCPAARMVQITSGTAGGLYNYGTLANINGTCYIGGSAGSKVYLSTNNAQCFYSMFINAGSTVTMQSVLTLGYIDIASGGTLDADSRQINLSGVWQQNGTFSAGVSTVNFTGTSDQMIQGTASPKTFANFMINSSSTVTPSGPLDINGSFTIQGGTFVAGNFEHTIAGNFYQTGGGFSAQTSTMNFDGTAAQTVSLMPGSAFNHFSYSGAGSLTPQSNLDINGNFTEGNGTFNCGNYTYNLAGRMSLNVGWTAGDSTWILDGTVPQNIQSGVGFANIIIKNSAGVKYNADIMGQIKNLSIDAGCSLESYNLDYLEITGNFTSSGTYLNGGSTTVFSQSGNGTIWTVASSTFNNLVIQKTSLSDTISVLTSLNIGGALKVNSGTLNMGATVHAVQGLTAVDGSAAKLDVGSSTTTLTGQLDVKNGGTLTLSNSGSVVKLGSGYLNVDAGGFLISQSVNNLITSISPGSIFYTLRCFASTVNVTGLTLQSAGYDTDALLISSDTKIVALDNVTYKDPLTATPRALSLGYSTIPGTYTFTGHNFGSMAVTNVYAPYLTSGRVVMQTSTGTKMGCLYENDPNDRVFWLPAGAGGSSGGDDVVINSPSGGETFIVGTSTVIRWTTYGSVKNVKLQYTKDDFATVNFIANVSTGPNFGTYNWTIPDDSSPTVKISAAAANYTTINTVSPAFAIQQPVAAPSNLKVGLLGTTSVQWTFTDNALDETALYVSSGADVTMRLSDNLGPVASGTTSWWETNLSTNTQYTRYAESVNIMGSSWSAFISSFTASFPPVGTKIVARSSNSVELDWQPNSNPEPGTGYIVSHSTLPDFSSEINGTASTSTYIVTALESATMYYFKVRSTNGDLVINQTYDAILATETLDGIPPTVAITEPAHGSYKNYASIFDLFYGPVSDNVAVSSAVISMRISGGNYTSGPAFDSVSPFWFDCNVYPSSWAYQPTPSDILTSGTMYVMEVKAFDPSGNWSSVTSSCTYDNTVPVSSVVSPADNTIINSLATISGTASDNTGVQGVELRIERLSDGAYWSGAGWSAAAWLSATGTSPWSYTGLTSSDLTDGASYWVSSRATDFAVNTSTLITGPAVFTYHAPVPGTFSGDFSQVGGAVFNSTGDDSAFKVAVDTISVGGPYIYVVGGSSAGASDYDYFTIKYNASGIMLASATYNSGYHDYAYDAAVDNSGNVYVTGQSYNSSANGDYFTVKYNSNLVVQSSATYNSGALDWARGIAIDSNGNVYVTGYSYNGANDDYVTVKYDSSLNVISSATYNGGGMDEAYAVAVDSSGNVYVTGEKSQNYHTIKYDPSFNVLQTAAYSGAGDDKPFGVAVSNYGDVYVTGESYNTGSNYDYFTIKYNYNLVVQTSVTYNSGTQDYAYDMALDDSNNAYVTGNSNGNFFTIKYNKELVVQSSATYDSGNMDSAVGVALDNNGYAYVAGYSFNGANNDFRTVRYQLPDLQAVVVPAVPTLTATEVTNSSIKWVWTDVANEQGYYLKTSTGGFVASVSADAVNYTETGLSPNMQYSRYVEAYNSGGISTSTVVSKYTLASLPASFVVSAKDYNFVALAWSANNNPSGTIYELYSSTDGSSFSLLNSSVSLSFTDTGLNQLTTYYYRLYSVNTESIKTGPAEVSVRTLNSVIKGPVSGKVTQSDGTAITGVSVYLYNNEGTVKLSETATKTDGTYLHDNLDDGLYRVMCSWLVNDIESVVYKTDIPENSTNVLFTLEIQYQLAQLAGKITLGSRANLSGRFAPSQQPYVELLQRGRVIAKIDADAYGNYAIPNLLPGKYLARAFNGVQMSEPQDLRIKEGEKVMLNFRWALGLADENVYAYPNPTKTGNTTIKYVLPNLNHTAKIHIYNIAGELVRDVRDNEITKNASASGGCKFLWDLKNDDGDSVASGIYIYMLELKENDTAEKATVKKKLAVIK